MFSKPQILIGTDFSYASEAALKMGQEISKRTGGSIKLVHFTQAQGALLDALEHSMKEQIKQCDIQCSSEIITASAYEGLHKAIEKMKPDLLIMGRHGKSALLHMGSLTQKLIASSEVPVLVVNQFSNIKNIAALIDPAAPSTKTIAAGEEISFLLSGKLDLISVIPDIDSLSLTYVPFFKSSIVFTEEEKELMRSRLTEEILKKSDTHSKADIHVEVTHQKIPQALLDILNQKKSDLVVMTRHNRGLMERIFIGSTTRGILEGFKGNLLVLPE